MGGRFVAIDRENHFLDERSQKFLLIARRRRGCVPDCGEVGAEGNKALSVCLAEDARSLLRSAGEFFVCRLQISQALLPLAFKPARDEPIVWIDGTIAPLCTLGFIGGPLDGLAPLLERRLRVGLEPLGGGETRGKLCRFDRGEEGLGERLVNLHAADVETVAAAALDDDFTGAVVAGGGLASAIMRLQMPTAMPAGRQ